jgi:uncharacterized membrane protein
MQWEKNSMNGQSSKWLIAFLVISIAINLIIIGYFIGFKPSNEDEQSSAAAIPQEINSIYQTVPSENRKELVNLLKQRQQEIVFNQRQIILLRLEIAQMIQQESFDKKRLAELFDRMSELSSKNVTLGQNTLYQSILVLPLAERTKIAKALMRMKVKKKASPSTIIPGAKPTSL